MLHIVCLKLGRKERRRELFSVVKQEQVLIKKCQFKHRKMDIVSYGAVVWSVNEEEYDREWCVMKECNRLK